MKKNQPKVFGAITDLFQRACEQDFANVSHGLMETEEFWHGWEDYRAVHLLKLPRESPFVEWLDAKTLAVVISQRIVDGRDS